MGLKIVRRSDAEMRAAEQARINKIRKGGFRKTADRAQKKLDKKK